MPELTPEQKKKKYRLRDLFIDRPDLVDRGANQHAEILLYKRDHDWLDVPVDAIMAPVRDEAWEKVLKFTSNLPTEETSMDTNLETRIRKALPGLDESTLLSLIKLLIGGFEAQGDMGQPGLGQQPPGSPRVPGQQPGGAPGGAPPPGGPPGADGAPAPGTPFGQDEKKPSPFDEKKPGAPGQEAERPQPGAPPQRPGSPPGQAGEAPKPGGGGYEDLLRRRKMKKSASETTSELFDVVTEGLIDADVFVDDATGADLRDILPSESVTKIMDILSAESTEATEGVHMDINLDALDDEAVAYVKSLQDDLEEAREVAKALTEQLITNDDDADPIEKALGDLPAGVAEIVKADRVRLEKAEAELATSRESEAKRIFVAKARTLRHVAGEVDQFADALRQVNDMAPEAAAVIEKAFEVANTRLAKSALFDEVGTAGATPGDTTDKIATIAKSLIEKSPDLTQEEAEVLVVEQNPDLYDEYQAERREAVRNA